MEMGQSSEGVGALARKITPARRRLTLAVLVGLAAGAIACNAPVERQLEAARRAFGRGLYQKAIGLYDEVVLQVPESPEAGRALYEQGVIYYLKLRDLDSAFVNFRKVITEHAGSAIAKDARLMLARMYQEDRGEHEKALREYRRLLDEIADTKERKDILLSVADSYYQMDDLEQAAQHYQRVIDLADYPNDEGADAAFLRRALIEALDGRREEALGILETLLEMTDEPDARYHAFLSAAEIRLFSNDYDQAKSVLVRAEREFPEDGRLVELADRTIRRARDGRSLDDGTTESRVLLEELQRNISWGRGRRQRTASR
jgi:tetratricopeptide (TPR) repeat protein